MKNSTPYFGMMWYQGIWPMVSWKSIVMIIFLFGEGAKEGRKTIHKATHGSTHLLTSAVISVGFRFSGGTEFGTGCPFLAAKTSGDKIARS